MQNEISNKPRGLLRPLNKSDVHWAPGQMILGVEHRGEHSISPEKGQREFRCLNLSNPGESLCSIRHPVHHAEMSAPFFQAKLNIYCICIQGTLTSRSWLMLVPILF